MKEEIIRIEISTAARARRAGGRGVRVPVLLPQDVVLRAGQRDRGERLLDGVSAGHVSAARGGIDRGITAAAAAIGDDAAARCKKNRGRGEHEGEEFGVHAGAHNHVLRQARIR